jgi:multidrug efflux pump subunit AcrA (membrane-fusion protein)
VLVEVGQTVKAGDPLFELDPRPLQADLLKAKAARDAAAAALARAQAQPRAETIPPLEAALHSAESDVSDWTDQLERFQEAMKHTGGGDMEMARRRYALDGAKARLEQARANLALARAGAWTHDVEVARADLAQAQAQVDAAQVLLDRRTVRSPINGTVLKRNIEPGQFAAAEPRAAAIVLGDLATLHVRARVDEEDLPMLHDGAGGQARIRGRMPINVPLRMLRIEPLAQPKTELSGDTTERVDTRVLEVVFEVQPGPGRRSTRDSSSMSSLTRRRRPDLEVVLAQEGVDRRPVAPGIDGEIVVPAGQLDVHRPGAQLVQPPAVRRRDDVVVLAVHDQHRPVECGQDPVVAERVLHEERGHPHAPGKSRDALERRLQDQGRARTLGRELARHPPRPASARG